MRTPRIHFAGPLREGDEVGLPEAVAHHLLRVLRLAEGAGLRLFNGDRGDWHATLERVGKRGARARIGAFERRDTESRLRLTLVQGLSRGQRMDYTLEKSVELGVARIVPVIMERSQAVPAGDRRERKQEHWRGVIASAAAQSGRTLLPELGALRPFSEWLDDTPATDQPRILLDPAAATHPADLGQPAALTLLAGPEGGFSPAERRAALAAGCTGMRLGPRILRTETAAVAALAALQTLYGDFADAAADP